MLPGKSAKITTALRVLPSIAQIKSGQRLKLTAVLKDSEGRTIPDRTVRWLAPQIGELSSPTGDQVNYAAPHVEVQTVMEVFATFEGDEVYTPCDTSCTITISAAAPFGKYFLEFDKAKLSNVYLEGPIEIQNVKVTRITAARAEFSTLTMNHFGLGCTQGVLKGIEILSTSIKMCSPEGGVISLRANPARIRSLRFSPYT